MAKILSQLMTVLTHFKNLDDSLYILCRLSYTVFYFTNYATICIYLFV